MDIKKVSVGGARNGSKYTHASISVIPTILHIAKFKIGDYYRLVPSQVGFTVERVEDYNGKRQKGIRKIVPVSKNSDAGRVLINRSELVALRLHLGEHVMVAPEKDGVLSIRKLDNREMEHYNELGGT